MPISPKGLRVAVVHNLKAGGAARRLAGTVGQLRARDVELREFTLTGPTVQLLEDRNCERLNWAARAPMRHPMLRPPARYADHKSLVAAWARVSARVNAWGPDVVFANPCSAMVGAPPTLGLLHAPIVYYCDEARRVDYDPTATQSRRGSTKLLYHRLHQRERADDRRGVLAATTLLTNSDYSAARINEAYGRLPAVVAPGVDRIFHPGTEEAAPTHVLSVGSLIPSKGHDLAIRASGLADTGLPVVIVAPRAAPAEQERLDAIAGQAGVQLRFDIAVSDSDLVALYRRALATVYLARSEPLGLVSLESQACGTPVIVADEGGLPSTVEPGRTGFRVERTAEAAAQGLRALSQPAVRREMAGHVRSSDVRRDESVATEILEVLRRIIVDRNPAVHGSAASA